MKETTETPKWTPITEKRPHRPGYYLVTKAEIVYENGGIYYYGCVQSLFIDSEIVDVEKFNYGDIIAWIHFLTCPNMNKWVNKLKPYIPETLDVMYRTPRIIKEEDL